MSKLTVAPNPREAIEALERRRGVTPLQSALSKARAMAWALEELGADCELRRVVDGCGGEEARNWLHSVVGEALRAAINRAEAAFLKATAIRPA